MQNIDLTAPDAFFLKALVYGEGGSGKTTFAGSAGIDPRTQPVLHLDALGNPVTLRRIKGYRGKVIRITKLSDLNYIFDWLYRNQPKEHVMVSKMGCIPGYKTLVIDGLTRIQGLSFEVALGTPTESIGTLLSAPEISHYKQILLQMTHDVQYIYELPMHVIITALEDKEKVLTRPGKVMQKRDKMGEEDQEGWYQFNPAIEGKAINTVKAAAQTVIRVANKNVVEPIALATAKANSGNKDAVYSIAQLQQSKFVYAKDQQGFNVNYLSDLTVAKLFDRLEKGANV